MSDATTDQAMTNLELAAPERMWPEFVVLRNELKRLRAIEAAARGVFGPTGEYYAEGDAPEELARVLRITARWS